MDRTERLIAMYRERLAEMPSVERAPLLRLARDAYNEDFERVINGEDPIIFLFGKPLHAADYRNIIDSLERLLKEHTS